MAHRLGGQVRRRAEGNHRTGRRGLQHVRQDLVNHQADHYRVHHPDDRLFQWALVFVAANGLVAEVSYLLVVGEIRRMVLLK
jgi:hypothetical protein